MKIEILSVTYFHLYYNDKDKKVFENPLGIFSDRSINIGEVIFRLYSPIKYSILDPDDPYYNDRFD